MTNFASRLLAAGEPEAPALLGAGGAVCTHGELRRRAAAVAAWIASREGQPGDRIALCAENGVFFVTAYLGILHAGRVAVPLNTDWTVESLASVTEKAGAEVLLASRRQAGRIRKAAANHPFQVVAEEECFREEESPQPVAVDPARALAALMFTSGSTGDPKGVMVTHRNLESNTRDIVDYLGLDATDRAMLVLPLHYCFGLSVLHTLLWAGGAVVINNQFLFPEAVLQDMQRQECTGLAGVPSTYQILLRKSRFKQLEFPALRWLQQAGGRLPSACIAEIRQAFPQVRFFTMYGQTEATARLSYLPPERLSDKLGSIGKGLPGTRLEVLKPDGSAVVPGSGEVGEVVASGDNICAGYWRDPAETARYFVDGKRRTGDLARLDEEGFLYIVDRERDMIKASGNRVSAKEIEDVICELPTVVEAAVIGMPHELMGEAIAAFVVAAGQPGLEREAILHHCRSRLPAFKVPATLQFVAQLPHNSSGKVLKNELRKRLAAGVAEIQAHEAA